MKEIGDGMDGWIEELVLQTKIGGIWQLGS
jgi:hypothetical protein